MASSSQDTYMDAYLFAIACSYDKFRLHLNASDVEKLLLQSIGDDADEAELKEYLTSTLLKITDEANEENGKFTNDSVTHGQQNKMKPLKLESPDVLAPGRVYEKAFREARHDTGVLAEKFFVLELEKDTRVPNI
jgi:hypothetical protein